MSQRIGIVLVTLVIGAAIGFGGGYVFYNPQLVDLQSEVLTLEDTIDKMSEEYYYLKDEFETRSEDFNILEINYNALDVSKNILQNQLDATVVELSNLHENYLVLEIDYSDLQDDYTALQEDHSLMEDDYDDLQDDYNAMISDYIYMSSRYESLSSSFDDACYYIKIMSEGFTDYIEYVDGYIFHEDSLSWKFTWDEVQPLSEKVWEITGGSSDLWNSIEGIYHWLDDNIAYSYDPPIPYLRPLSSTTFEGYEVYTSFLLSNRRDHNQPLSFTLDYQQGDCDDQAALTYAMIKYYMKEIYGTEYNIYLMETNIGTTSGHVSVLLPVTGGKITIIDPVGDDYGSLLSFIIGPGRGYLTQDSGIFGLSITSKPAYEELVNYSNRYASLGGITYIKLYDIDISDGTYIVRYEGNLAQIASQLGS